MLLSLQPELFPTSDCLAGCCKRPATPNSAFSLRCRIEAIVRLLLDRLPGADVALLGLLPRGRNHTLPSVFSRAINSVNSQFR